MKSCHLFDFDLLISGYLGREDSASLICTCISDVYYAVLTFLAFHMLSYSSIHVHVGCFKRPHRKTIF